MTEYASRHLLPEDRHLRRDIRLMGWQLRRLVRDHQGVGLWDTLHRLREWAEERLHGDPDAEQRMAELLRTQSVERLAELTRAMGLFFDLANLAEDRQRVRVLRLRRKLNAEKESLDSVAALLTPMSERERINIRQNLHIEPVLTAHPTEAKRRSIRRAMRRIRGDLAWLDRPDILPVQRKQRLQRMQRDIACLWYTDPLSARKPTVMEELDRTLYAVHTIWRVVPRVMRALRAGFGIEQTQAFNTATPLSFGNWIGGDRDGNPFVTTDVTRRTLTVLRSVAIRLHQRECRRVMRHLTASAQRTRLPLKLKARIDEAAKRWPELELSLRGLHPDEWLVQWGTVIHQRLAHSRGIPGETSHPMAYRNSSELAGDVEQLIDGLVETDHQELLGGAVFNWRDRISVFGLHLLRVDVRVNSMAINTAVGAIIRQLDPKVDYLSLGEAERRRIIQRAVEPHQTSSIDASALPEEVRDLLAALKLTQYTMKSGGGEALGAVILSMTHQASDLLALRWLMTIAARLNELKEPEPVPLVPLFETIIDLERSDQILDQLLQDPGYRSYLQRDGNRQICMIGYSDSAKDGGYLASNWGLYRAQRRLSMLARSHGIELTVFHGRGGAIGRGGGPAARAILSLPPEAIDGRLRLTEQGEVIAERYDDPVIAHRHLEQLIWATLTLKTQTPWLGDDRSTDLTEKLARQSEQAYRQLLEMPGFSEYLRQCTPLPMIESLPIGSRPSRRTQAATLAELRAIPFTFAWNQVRLPINAFYGLGYAFASLSETDQHQTIELYRRWPWFRAVIDNAELALARCDPRLARRYIGLAPDHADFEPIWHALAEECKRANKAVLQIKGQSELLADVPWLQRTIRVRTPYIDMLNLVQVELRQRYNRENNPDMSAMIQHDIRGTIQAIAAGLRNTG